MSALGDERIHAAVGIIPEMEMVTKGTPGESVGAGTQSQERWEW